MANNPVDRTAAVPANFQGSGLARGRATGVAFCVGLGVSRQRSWCGEGLTAPTMAPGGVFVYGKKTIMTITKIEEKKNIK